jgi:hypothetical protein
MRYTACLLASLIACGGGGDDSPNPATTAAASSTPKWPDACSLLTQAEAEEVLGALVRPPYPDSTGQGCAYETAGNKKFIIKPEWMYGKFELDAERMVGGMIAMVGYTPEAVADTLEGPWDEVAFGVTGIVFRVKARALTVSYANSGTNLSGALKLSKPALKRLGAVPEPERPKIASSSCPLDADEVSEILGQEVRVAVGQGGRQDACDFDLVLDPTIQVELRVQPENLGEMVFDAMKATAKAMLGQNAEPHAIQVGEGGLSWGSTNSGGEAAARANGKVYHARIAAGIMSSVSVEEERIVKLVERMIQ